MISSDSFTFSFASLNCARNVAISTSIFAELAFSSAFSSQPAMDSSIAEALVFATSHSSEQSGH
jgi:hypothetical protein